jgi:hypothetical protein
MSEPVSLRVVMVSSDICSDIDDGLELNDEPTVILQGGIAAVKAASMLFGERVELLRADLHRAEIEAAVKRAIEACADEIDCGGCYGQCQDPANCHAKEASAIRALASDRASLERIINGGADE